MVLFTTSFDAVHTLHTLSDYGREDGFVASSSAIASIAGLFWVFLFAEVAVASVGPGTACIASSPVASPAAVAECWACVFVMDVKRLQNLTVGRSVQQVSRVW
jgi:hypothetical protein